DPAQAYAWLSLAAANGTNGKALAQLTSLLTPEQLAEGKRRLAILTASPISPAADASSPIISTVTASHAPVAPPAADADADQKKLSAELSAAWKENELLKAGLTAQLADANKRVAIAEAALASKDKEITALQSRLTEAAAPPAVAPVPVAPIGVSAELASLRTERDQLQVSATAALSQLTELRSQNAKVAAEENALREKLTRASADLTAARRAQAQAEAESASLKAAADRASAERLAVAAQLETVTTELAAAKTAATPSADSSAQTEQARIAENLKTLERQHAEVAAQLEQANSQNTLVRTQYTKLLADAQTTAKASADEAGQLRAQLASTEEKLAAAKAAAAETTKSVVLKADPRVAALESERDRLATSIKSLETERASLVLRLAEAQAAATAAAATPAPTPTVTFAPVTTPAVDTETAAKLAALEKTKAETDDKLAAALRSFTLQQAEIDRLQKALASIDAERAATATQLEAATTELTTLRPQAASAASVSADAENLRTQLAAAKQTIADQSASLATANRSLTDARQTVDAATTDLVATRDQLRQTQAQSAAFAVENQQLKTKFALTGSLPSSTAPSRPGTIPSISVNLPAATVAPAATQPAPAATAVASTPAAPRVHTIASGDSLSKISKQYYGTANRWNDILQANKDVIRNPDALVLGTKLRIP
ncbi:MAG: LysM peptidoglycan-binding domain-containing protein, partial [Opitutaceae bacterium]|nr:LysM peptidoglycan-binding domain-containing protein [Opitutaceae bacterium]